jgi:hypothetical protein
MRSLSASAVVVLERAAFAVAAVALAPLAGCAAATPSAGPAAEASVRDRLADETRLFIAGDASTGSITARRKTHGGWIEGSAPLAIESGDLSASLVDDDLALHALTVHLAPIALPDDVFGTHAELTDIVVSLSHAAMGAIAWADDDAATARISLPLDLAWTIRVDGGKTPLASVHLPPVDVDIALDGDGDAIDATLDVAATGELWSWAGILELSHIDLALGARSTD